VGIIGTALGEAAGMTMNQVGTAMIAADIRREENEGRWAVERERIAKDIILRREELNERRREADLRWGDDEGGSGSSSGSKGKKGSLEAVFADMIKKNPELYGINQPLPGADKFTTTIDVPAGDGVGPPAPEKKYDAEGHERAKKGIIDSNIERAGQVFKSKDYKDLEEGKGQALLNKLFEQAQAETDPAKREARVQDLNKFAIAAGAKDRFEVKDGTVVDVATGATRTTEVGKSEIKKNEGAANESNADARKAAAKGTDGMSKTELIQHNTNLRATMGSIERELKSERAMLDAMGGKKDSPERLEKISRINRLVKDLDDTRAEINATDKKVAAAREAPASDKPKTDKPKVDAKQPPKISEVTGAPAGAKIGVHDSKGWQVLDAKGKVIGYVGN